MHPYSFTVLQAFRPGDNTRRIDFCEFLVVKMQEDANFLSKIIWTDEAKFTREGIINRRNLHHWAQENPHAVREAHFQDTFSFNVFAIMMNDQIHYEIYQENLTSARYLQLLRGVVTDFLENLPLNAVRDCWYQMDGAPAHSSREVSDELTTMFDDRWIGYRGPWRWPPRSPDLTPVDFFLWGHIKNLVYSRPVHNRDELLNRVEISFQGLRDQTRRATTYEMERRVLKCLAQNGSHIEHI
jgi:hypothetical protein